MKAHEWWARGETTTDSFDALSNYWRGFNNLFAGQGIERQLISDFLHSRLDESFAQELLNTHVQEVDYLTSTPIVDMRLNGKDTSQHIENFNAATTAIERVVALFMVIYQIRCNFEHGQKLPSRERDKKLCQAACPFVARVVQHTV